MILLVAMGDFLIGTGLPPTDVQVSRGYLGWSSMLLAHKLFLLDLNCFFFHVHFSLSDVGKYGSGLS